MDFYLVDGYRRRPFTSKTHLRIFENNPNRAILQIYFGQNSLTKKFGCVQFKSDLEAMVLDSIFEDPNEYDNDLENQEMGLDFNDFAQLENTNENK